MIRQCSRYCKSEYKNKETTNSRIQNMPGSTDQDANSIDFNFSPIAH